MDSVMPFLPQEIVTNILKRLPVKSLLRFQCVCKHWKNLIKTQSFIEDHLHHSLQNPSLLFQRNPKGDTFCLYLIDCHVKPLQILNVPISNPSVRVSIVDSTNGLVCLKGDVSGLCLPSFLLWNPATKQVRSVPPNIYDFKGKCHSAFGFTPIGNDYKIVMIHDYDDEDEDGDGDGFPILVEVYSLCTGSWKEVNYFDTVKPVPVSDFVTANGVMFCFGSEDDEIICIISFDLAMETFSRIPMPYIVSNNGFQLAVYENKLAIAAQTWSLNWESLALGLWVMEEGEGASEKRWTLTKKCTISSNPEFLFPSCIWKNEFVGIVNNKASGHNSEAESKEEKKQNEVITVLSMTNFSTNESQNFPIHIRRCIQSSALFNYAESLEPVDLHL